MRLGGLPLGERFQGFNTRTSPKAGATARRRWGSLIRGSFNTRTSPKAGATRARRNPRARNRVSTHAPARRPVRLDPGVAFLCVAEVSTHAPARRPVRRMGEHSKNGKFRFQHTHQPEGRCDGPDHLPAAATPSFNTRTSPKAGATHGRRLSSQMCFRFNTRTSPKAGATSAASRLPADRRSFNTRTSPKAGATRWADVDLAANLVSTHAPARRPVRPQPG